MDRIEFAFSVPDWFGVFVLVLIGIEFIRVVLVAVELRLNRKILKAKIEADESAKKVVDLLTKALDGSQPTS